MSKPTPRITKTQHSGIWKLEWPSGRVTYRATAPWWIDGAGKRHDPRQNFERLADARDWRTEQLKLRQRGVRTPTGRGRVGEYLDEWIDTYTRRSPGNTAAGYRRALEKLRARPLWRMRLADVELDDVAGAYDALEPKQVSYVHDALHKAFADAVPKLLGHNPAAGAAAGRRLERAERAVWTESEYQAFLAAAGGDELYALWHLIGQTGMRRGEALGVDWPDVDLENASITVRRQYTPSAGILTVKDVKTKSGRRTIEIDAGTVAVLREWQKRQAKQHARRLGRDAHAVFTFGDGSRVGPSRALNDRFRAVVAAAGVRALTIHDVRHTHASLLLRRHVPVQVVSRRLGHANEAITLQLYAHLLPDMARAAAEAAAAIAGGTASNTAPRTASSEEA